MRDAITPKKQLTIALNWYATGVRYASLEIAWGIGKSTVAGIVHRVTEALYSALAQVHIVFPTTRGDVERVINGFEEMSGLPQCGGAVDGCFIPMKKPPGKFGSKFWCYKHKHAIILLASVDHTGCLTYINVGNAGCVGDAATFRNSLLMENLKEGKWLGSAFSREIDGRSISPFVVGDSAFPLFPLIPFMMKNCKEGFPEGSVQHSYNQCHIQARRVVENAFGIMKMRFQVLRSSQMTDPDFLSLVVTVCCVLHNICIRLRDSTETGWEPNYKKAIEDGLINGIDDDPYDTRGESTIATDDRIANTSAMSAAGIRLHLARYVQDLGY